MWTYGQATGRWCGGGGTLLAVGYSGHGEGLNNPGMQSHVALGPLPRGTYRLGMFFDHPHLGPTVARLRQVSGEAFGRSGFFVHGDNARHDHSASDGCIVLPRDAREQIAGSRDRDLTVTA